MTSSTHGTPTQTTHKRLHISAKRQHVRQYVRQHIDRMIPNTCTEIECCLSRKGVMNISGCPSIDWHDLRTPAGAACIKILRDVARYSQSVYVERWSFTVQRFSWFHKKVRRRVGWIENWDCTQPTHPHTMRSRAQAHTPIHALTYFLLREVKCECSCRSRDHWHARTHTLSHTHTGPRAQWPAFF